MIMCVRYDLRGRARDYRRYRWRCQTVVFRQKKSRHIAGGFVVSVICVCVSRNNHRAKTRYGASGGRQPFCLQ